MSYNDGLKQKQTTLQFARLQEDQPLFKIFKNVTIQNLVILSHQHHQFIQAFQLKATSLVLTVEYCIFSLSTDFFSVQLFDTTDRFASLYFYRTKFANFGKKDFSNITFETEKTQESQNGISMEQNIHFRECFFINSTLTLGLFAKANIISIIIANSIFKNTYINLNSFQYVNLTGNRFHQSSAIIVGLLRAGIK